VEADPLGIDYREIEMTVIAAGSRTISTIGRFQL
jgi:hypothetical protein